MEVKVEAEKEEELKKQIKDWLVLFIYHVSWFCGHHVALCPPSHLLPFFNVEGLWEEDSKVAGNGTWSV